MFPGKRVKKHYLLLKKIGSGSFAEVWQCNYTLSKDLLAIKIFESSKLKKQPKVLQLMQSEIKVLQACNSENIVKYHDSFEDEGIYSIVMEYCNRGDLEEYVTSQPNSRLSEEESIAFLKQLLNGFKELHRINAIHRDFKLENVLLHNDILKIADLGFCSQSEVPKTTLGTRNYMAPEIMNHQKYNNKVDIWSLGVGLYRMVFGEYPFETKEIEGLKKGKNSISFDVKGVDCSDALKDLIKNMLVIDPEKRIEWKDIYSHEALNNNNNQKNGVFLTSLIRPMGKKEILQEHNEILFKKNKSFYSEKEETKAQNSNEFSVISPEKSQNQANFKKKIPENHKEQEPYYGEECYNNEEKLQYSEQEFEKALNMSRRDFSEQQFKNLENNSLKNSNYNPEYSYDISFGNKEVAKCMEELEENRKIIAKIENEYFYRRNIIAFHAKMLNYLYETYYNLEEGAKGEKKIVFMFYLAYRIKALAEILAESLEKKENIGKWDESYFERFLKSQEFEHFRQTFSEEINFYRDFFDNLRIELIENFEMKEISTKFQEIEKETDFKGKFDRINDYFKEAITEYFLNERNQQKIEKMKNIHLIEVLDIFNYKDIFKYENDHDGGFNFNLYEKSYEYEEEGALNNLLDEKIELFLDN